MMNEMAALQPADWIAYRAETTQPALRNVGLLALSMDEVCAGDLADFLSGTDLTLITTRVRAGGDFPEPFCDMGDAVAEAVAQLVPGQDLEAIVFGCTACSLAVGHERVAGWVAGLRPGVPVIDPMTAIFEELMREGCQRVGVISPYSMRANVLFAPALAERGITLTAGLHITHSGTGPLPQPDFASWEKAFEELCARGPLDGIVVSCATMRMAPVLNRLADRFGVPVISSNQAVAAWLRRTTGQA